MKTRTETGYGFFCGGDPRRFYPDGESCSAKEKENHAAAVLGWRLLRVQPRDLCRATTINLVREALT